jgi:hypothetical protein
MRKFILWKYGVHANMDLFAKVVAAFGNEPIATLMPPFMLITFESSWKIDDMKNELEQSQMGQFILFDVTDYGQNFTFSLPMELEQKIFGSIRPESSSTGQSLAWLKGEEKRLVDAFEYEKAAIIRDKINQLIGKIS